MLVKLGRLQTIVRVGDILAERCPRFLIESSRFVSTTKGAIRLWDINFDLLKTIKRGDPASITMGYTKQEKHTWNFTVDSMHEIQKNTLDIQLVQDDVLFKRNAIKKNWENESPAPIVQSIIEEVGFQAGEIEPFPISLKKFIASSRNAWDTIKHLERSLKLSNQSTKKYLALWQDTEKRFNWNGKFEKSKVPRMLAVGYGLVKHNINNKATEIDKAENVDIPLNSVETFLSPELKHSQTIKIEDKRKGINGEFPIIDVKHQFFNSSVSTFINYLPVDINHV